MSNVKDLLGHELEPYSMAVEKEKIKELAIAIGDDNPITEGWETKAFTVSALTGEGVSHIWKVIQKYKQVTSRNGFFGKRRKRTND
ncbi:hypothetical protein BS1321_01535 [Peribacillus simplex NBRC 15720 = DSM 1321]|uniref:Uncharacterized protein n=1 Tax=Peribacillus simplex NBRC 15720 = DSM 1321 TaxID=1349754 RepID=A0A223EBZ1_9BACI|nr:hypothetical protein BS1321_01535 [Peribacillus simplex NBRC 15720 = DSM 1321]